jgi:predicted dehydrogenase
MRQQRQGAADDRFEIVRWGIVGPGRIASLVIKDFPYVDGAEALAVASRSSERAEAFASEHGLARAYGSYHEIMNDPEVDVLYIATPHPQHHAIALAAIAAGKAVLVEKTFTATVPGAEEIIDAAGVTRSSRWRQCGPASSQQSWRLGR